MNNIKFIINVCLLGGAILSIVVLSSILGISQNHNTIDQAITEFGSIVADSGEISPVNYQAFERRVFSTGAVYQIQIIVFRPTEPVNAVERKYIPIFSMRNTEYIDPNIIQTLRIGDEVRIEIKPITDGSFMEKLVRQAGFYVPSREYNNYVKVRSDGGSYE